MDGVGGFDSADRGNFATKRSLVELFSSLFGNNAAVEKRDRRSVSRFIVLQSARLPVRLEARLKGCTSLNPVCAGIMALTFTPPPMYISKNHN